MSHLGARIMRTHDGVLAIAGIVDQLPDGTIIIKCVRCDAVVMSLGPHETGAKDGLSALVQHELTSHWTPAVALAGATDGVDVVVLKVPS